MLEAFAVTGFNKIFSGRQPHQDVKVIRHFRDWRPWNGGELSPLDAAVCPRRSYWI